MGLAQAKSDKTESHVVPFAVGGIPNTLARALSQEMVAALAQTVMVENRAGAGGTIGIGFVAPTEQADGIHAAISKLLKDPKVLERLDKQGIEPCDLSNADFSKRLAADHVRMAQGVKASGAQID